MKRTILTFVLAVATLMAMGQEVKVDTVMTDSVTADTVKADTYVEQEGMRVYAEIKDHFTHDPVKMRCVTLLMAADSAFVDTVPTYYENEEDYKSSHLYKVFKEAGKYLFKLEADGYQTMFVPFELKKIYKRETLRELKTVYLKPVPKKNERMLDEVVVKATKLKFYMDGDTLVYDADAFNLAEGSMLGELMKKLPGVEVEQGGVIKVNGRQIDAMLLNGKDFFDSERELLLENMPSYMVKNIQAYEKVPDEVKGTPREETTRKAFVMNVKLKKEYAKGWIANAEGGVGATFFRNDEGRFDTKYLGRIFGMRFTDRERLVLFANVNNLNDYRTPGEKGEWTPLQQSEGLKTTYKLGGNYMKKEENHYSYQGNLEASYTKTEDVQHSSSATFLEGGDTYSRSFNNRRSDEWELNTQHELTLQRSEPWADLIKNLYFTIEPLVRWRHQNNTMLNGNATFDDDVEEQLGKAWIDSIMAPDAGDLLRRYAINRTQSRAKGNGHTVWANVNPYMNFSPAHNDYIHFNISSSYNFYEWTSNSYNHNRIDYPKGKQPTDFRNRYQPQLNRNHTAFLHPSVTFDLDEDHRLGVGYRLQYNYEKTDNPLYLLNKLEDWNDVESHPLGSLPSKDELLTTLDANNSSHFIKNQYRHEPTLSYGYSKSLKKGGYFYFITNLSFPMTHEKLDYHRGTQVDTLLHRNTTFMNVDATCYYTKWEKGRSLNVNVSYNMEVSAPSMTSLLNIRDDSNPLYITLGNPNLKNERRHTVHGDYRDKFGKTLFNVSVNANLTENAEAWGYIYNKQTGVRTVTPENVDGNWSMNVSPSVDFAIDKNDKWRVKQKAGYTHTNSVDLSGTDESVGATKSVVVSNYVTEDLTLTWRPSDKLEFGTQGKLNYQHSGSDRENFTTINAFTYQYGVRGQVELPWNMQVATDLTMYSRRGYSEASMNTNELVWNARVAKRLMHGNLTVMFDGFDLLGNLSNVRRYINAQGRSETFVNVIPSYGLLHIIWRLNKQPKKNDNTE